MELTKFERRMAEHCARNADRLPYRLGYTSAWAGVALGVVGAVRMLVSFSPHEALSYPTEFWLGTLLVLLGMTLHMCRVIGKLKRLLDAKGEQTG